jgi:hypothetical protein
MTNDLFQLYGDQMISQGNLLKQFVMPDPLTMKIDWDILENVSLKGNKKDWSSIPFFESLISAKNSPAVYYFRTSEYDVSIIHQAFLERSFQSAMIRKSKGLRADGFINYSHVPKSFNKTTTLYVGSVRKNVHLRLREHLGYASGRTGALYLRHVLSSLSPKPEIEYFAHILPARLEQVREHIECVVQDYFKPMIGKRAYRLKEETINT